MITFAHISLGAGGAVSCSACTGRGQVTMRPLAEVVADIDRATNAWHAGPGPNVAFVGVEPFAYPQLPQVIGDAVESGCERIRLRTDGGALSRPGNAEGVLRAGVRHLEIVLLAGDAADHDRLSGRPGLFDAVFSGVNLFVAAAREAGDPIAITGYVPLCRHAAPHLARAMAAFARLGTVSVLAEPVAGFKPPAAGVADALRAATVSGIALHGPGISPFVSGPWTAQEVSP